MIKNGKGGANSIQKDLDKITRFFHYTCDIDYDNWDYNGKELLVFYKNKIIERYKRKDLKEAQII